MALDPSIALSFQPQRINTPFQNLDIVLDAKRKQQQVRENEIDLKQKETDAQDREALQQIWSQYGDDPATAIKLTKARNPVLGMKMEAEMHRGAIEGLDLQIKQQQIQADKIDRHLTRLISVQPGDDELWQHVRGLAAKEDPEVGAQLPEHLLTAQDVAQRDAVAAQGQRAGAVLKARLEEQNRIRDDARTAAKDAATQAHQSALESAAARTAERLEAGQQASQSETARHNQAMEAIGRARANRPAGGSGSTDRDDAAAIADAIIRGEQPPETTGLYRMGPLVKSELARKGYDQATAVTDWRATQKHIATLNGAQQTRMGQAIDNASHSLDVIDELAKKWDAGRFPMLNRAQLKIAIGGGMGPEAQKLATQLEGQISDVTSELANVYMGGNSPTDHALELAAKNLSADWSRPQLTGMVAQSKRNLQIRANSMKNVGVAGASANNPYAQQGEPLVTSPGGGGKEQVIEYVRDPKTGKLVRK